MKNKSLMYSLLGAVVLVVVVVVVIMVLPGGSKNGANVPAVNPLIGTWTSATPGKGMQATGTATILRKNYEYTVAGDVTVVIQSVENNIASGTITYTNACLTVVSRAPQCITSLVKPVQLQINGNAITFDSQTEAGVDVSFTGTYTNNAMSGTFVRTSSIGKASGTFNLVRA